jgi:ribosomal protein S6
LKTYDLLLIFFSSVKEEDLEKGLENVHTEIERLGGTVAGTNVLGRRAFARPMQKEREGLYVRMKVALGPDKVSALLARLKLNTRVLRVQITNVREVTVEKVSPDETPAESDVAAKEDNSNG